MTLDSLTGNRMGEARTEAERELEAALAQTPRFAGPLRYRPVSGGISNANWRVTLDTGVDYFVKMPGRGTEMFIDRAAAFQASRLAGEAGIGPRLHDDLSHLGVEINDFIPDRRPTTHSDFANPAARLAAIDAYRRFHALPALSLTKTVFDMIDEHVAQMRDLGSPWPTDWAWVDLNQRMAREALTASGLDLTPCFNDPMPGNFMIGSDGSIQLIDYEYASMNDRCYDLGIWFGEMFYTEAVERELIEAYFSRCTPELFARVTVHKALADVKWACWSFVQMKISALDFDYFKYGAWKLMRFRTIIAHPDWEAHLRRL
jgi:thiamine kinase-like enzyme